LSVARLAETEIEIEIEKVTRVVRIEWEVAARIVKTEGNERIERVVRAVRAGNL